MNELYIELLAELHKNNQRQGPGSMEEMQKMLLAAKLDATQPLRIADIGCGTGAASLFLAKTLPQAHITAVDFLPQFLEKLRVHGAEAEVSNRIHTVEISMDALPFAPEEFDCIWSEGAIYNIGFEHGIAAWKPFLKPHGKLVLTEITWLGKERPQKIHDFWTGEYPEIATASVKMAQLEQCGYMPEAYWFLPKDAWEANYYTPLQQNLTAFYERIEQSGNAEKIAMAKEIIAAEKAEQALYAEYGNYYGYGVYIAQKL